MSTDADWQAWGERDPYYAVLTEQRYRDGRLTPEALDDFFRSGREHLTETLAACRQHLGEVSTQRSLDFGCGVGRVLIPLSELSEVCAGVDVAAAMLEEAARNCARFQRRNVRLVRALEELPPAPEGSFTFVHSYIVLQHLEPGRGLHIIRALLARLATGGVAALHVTYAQAKHRSSFGASPLAKRLERAVRRPFSYLRGRLGREPRMQMNAYDMNRVLFVAQDSGARVGGLRFTEHYGHYGVMLFLRRA
jgi:SAM-dependent methyltransferase